MYFIAYTIPFSYVKNIFSSVNSSNLTPVFLKHPHQDNIGVVKK